MTTYLGGIRPRFAEREYTPECPDVPLDKLGDHPVTPVRDSIKVHIVADVLADAPFIKDGEIHTIGLTLEITRAGYKEMSSRKWWQQKLEEAVAKVAKRIGWE